MRRSKPDINTRINSDFPKFGLGRFKKAMAAGYGEEAVGAVIKALRTG